jgi:hypothetical protein
MRSRAGADHPKGEIVARLPEIGGPGAAFLSVQAMVEYGALNTLFRDLNMAMQRVGGWAADHPLIIAGVLAVGIVLAFRRR